MDTEAFGAEGEAAWGRLVRRLGQLQGFGYIVLFVSGPALLKPFRARLASWMAGQGWPWLRLSEARPEGFAERSIAALFDGLSARPAPRLVWLEAHRGDGQPAWEQARGELLSRLNERRGRLEDELAGTLVLVLPEGTQRTAAGMAPDLWHVRSLGLSLGPAPLAHEGQVLPARAPAAVQEVLPSKSAARVAQGGVPLVSDTSAAAWLQRWHALLAGRSADDLPLDEEGLLAFSIWDARGCQEALRRQGRLAEALVLGEQWIRLARRRRAQGAGLLDVATLRELAAALEAQGAILLQAGRAEEAWPVLDESLDLARELASRLGETPAALREQGRVLEHLGHLAQSQGDLQRAAARAEDSLALQRRLANRLGETPDSLRHLAQALDRIGQLARLQGDWWRAGSAYEECLSLRQALASRLGDSPEALRDLSIALDNIGRVAEAQGDWARGAEAYEEALTLRRLLIERQGGVPERLAQSRAQLAQAGAAPDLEADLASTLLDAASLPGPRAEAYRQEAGQILAELCRRHPGVERYERLQQRWAHSNARSAASQPPSELPPHQPQAGS